MSLILKFCLFWSFCSLLGVILSFCPKDGGQGSSGQCYFTVIYNETFNRADHFCANYFNGHLASISNVLDNNLLLNLARDNLMNAENIWLGGVYDGSDVTWNDGSPDVYRHFGKNVDAGDMIMSLSTGLWATATWNANLPFACVVKDTPSTTMAPNTAPPPTDSCPLYPPCPPNWVYSPDFKSCYKTIYNVNFAEAQEQCQSMNSQLASIHSEAENQLVVELTKTGRDVVDPAYETLIGGKRTGLDPKDWVWLDGSPFNYTYWADGEPNNDNEGNEYCMQIWVDPWNGTKATNTWKWNDYQCGVRYRVALCKQLAKY